MKNQRIIYLDWLRIIACAMVVLMHTPHPDSGVPGFVQVPLYFITAAGLVSFFMVSGALLLPSNIPVAQFLKRRVGKIAGPWLFWTLFYMAINVPQKGLSLSVVDELFVYVSSPGRHVMWFMFVLLALYLITPILSKFVQNATKNENIFYLFLWCVTLILPWFSPYTSLDLSISSPVYYFSGYVGYFLLGYFLSVYKTSLIKYVPILLIVPIVARLIYTLLDGQRSDEIFWYLSLPVMLMSIALFTLIQRIFANSAEKKIIKKISDSTFGIYLVHIFIMRSIIWKVDFIVYSLGWYGQILLTWSLTFLLSYAVTYIISMIPYSEYIVGFRTKHK